MWVVLEIKHAESIMPLPSPLINLETKTIVAKSLELSIFSTESHNAKLAKVSIKKPKLIAFLSPNHLIAGSIILNEISIPQVYPVYITPTSKHVNVTYFVRVRTGNRMTHA